MKHSKFSAKKLVLLAMLAAVSYLVVTLIRIPVMPAAPFLNYEPKDVVVTISGFLLGPMASFLISVVVSLVEMVTISSTGPIGGLMNLLSTCAFSCTAALVYKKRHTMAGAVWGLGLGTVAMISVMLLWNWLITPLYMGVSRDAVEGMLLPVFLPFNTLKACFNSAFVLMLYKPLVGALRKTGLVPTPTKHGSVKIGIYLLAAALLVSCIFLLLVMQGKI